MFDGTVQPVPAAAGATSKAAQVQGKIVLGNELEPGTYLLRVAVSDPNSRKSKGETVEQWADFTID